VANTISWRDVVLVLLLIVYSGNQAPGRIFPLEPQIVALALIFGFLLYRQARPFLSRDFIILFTIFATILLIQCISFSFYPFITIAGFFVRLFIGYSVVRLVSDFPKVYVRIMVGLAVLSFLFYVPYQLLSFFNFNFENLITETASILGTLSPSRRPLFLHTFMRDYSPRNAGMFWEPGAFAGYLILALVFLAFVKNKISRNQYTSYLFVLVAALISTLSTTGYIALLFIPFLHYKFEHIAYSHRTIMFRFLVVFYIILPLIILSAFYAYKTLPFLEQKIEHEIFITELQEGRWYRGRVGSLVFDTEYIKQRPFTGWGLHSNTRYALHPGMESSEGMGNGFSDFIAKFGVIAFLIWLYAVFLSFREAANGRVIYAALVCAIIIILLQGECFLGFPLFLGLAFIRRPNEMT
jgi:hypothetical protein